MYIEKKMCRTIEEAQSRIVDWFRSEAIDDVKTVREYRHEAAGSPRGLPAVRHTE